MKDAGFVTNIEQDSINNDNFRAVLYTDARLQLVVMSLLPREDIGEETHVLDQFIRIETGDGKCVLDDVVSEITDGMAIVIPAGTKHNIINLSSDKQMKLYTLYSPPQHIPGTIHKTKSDAQRDKNEA